MIKNSVRYEASLNLIAPDELDHLGRGLNVLICSDYKFQYNWMTFAAWYSVAKSLPSATVGITAARTSDLDRFLFTWAYKVPVKYFMHKNIGEANKLPYLNKLYGVYVALKEGVLTQPLLVMDADMMVVSTLSASAVRTMKEVQFASSVCPYQTSFNGNPVGPAWYFNNTPLEKIEEAIDSLKSCQDNNHLDLQALAKVFWNREVIEDLCGDATQDGITTIAHYPDKCGKFTKKEWEKGKVLPPFNVCGALSDFGMTANEKKILTLWSQMGNLYNSLTKVKS